MGFGWLFIGYFVTFMVQMNPYAVFAAPIGIAIIIFAAAKLYKYCHKFHLLVLPAFVMLVGFVLNIVSAVSELASLTLPYKSIFEVMGDNVYFVGSILFHIALMLAVRDIADKVELPKIKWGALRNFIVFALYALIYGISLLPLKTIDEFNKLMSVPYIALWIGFIILNLIMLFSCYMRICQEGDEDMPQRPSKIKIFNKMNDALNKKQDEIAESQRQYKKQKAKKKLEKQKSKKK